MICHSVFASAIIATVQQNKSVYTQKTQPQALSCFPPTILQSKKAPSIVWN